MTVSTTFRRGAAGWEIDTPLDVLVSNVSGHVKINQPNLHKKILLSLFRFAFDLDKNLCHHTLSLDSKKRYFSLSSSYLSCAFEYPVFNDIFLTPDDMATGNLVSGAAPVQREVIKEFSKGSNITFCFCILNTTVDDRYIRYGSNTPGGSKTLQNLQKRHL